MKKLNRKGFTLVELLAVIIILAIVVGISIPSITTIINDSKNNSLDVAVKAASDYLTDQYSYMNIDYNTASEKFREVFGASPTTAQTLTDDLIKEAGFDTDNVYEVQATLKGDKICVTVVSITTTSEYYSTKYWNTDGSPKTGANNSNC